MPFVKYKSKGLHTLSDAARACGMDLNKFWKFTREKKLLPEPTTQVGRREYYSDAELKALLKKADALRTEGVLP